jgi:hypothetical protein
MTGRVNATVTFPDPLEFFLLFLFVVYHRSPTSVNSTLSATTIAIDSAREACYFILRDLHAFAHAFFFRI